MEYIGLHYPNISEIYFRTIIYVFVYRNMFVVIGTFLVLMFSVFVPCTHFIDMLHPVISQVVDEVPKSMKIFNFLIEQCYLTEILCI